MPDIPIPPPIATTVGQTAEGRVWLKQLPQAIHDLSHRWSLTLGPPFVAESSCSWVAPCIRSDGSSAVLKLGMPHLEAEQEIAGLRFWAGEPTVFVLEADLALNAMLLECCDPGTHLRQRPELEQDQVIASLLPKLWRTPPRSSPFRPLSEMIAYWTKDTLIDTERWPDAGLAQEGLDIFEELLYSPAPEVMLATDLHAGNVLQAEREPWLVIDPKPFYGDPAYDATQHLLNCRERLQINPDYTIRRFADLLGVDPERVRLWTFARLAAAEGGGHTSQALARRLVASTRFNMDDDIANV